MSTNIEMEEKLPLSILINQSSPLSENGVTVFGKKENNASDVYINDFFAMFEQLWGTLLNLARRLRDVMRMYNEKKQILGWELEVNSLSTSFGAINHSFKAARYNALGNILGGATSLVGIAGSGGSNSVLAIGANATGQTVNGALSLAGAVENRTAEIERVLADFQNKNAQSYVRNLDEVVQKASEIMQQMMDMGRKMVEVFSQTLHAFAK